MLYTFWTSYFLWQYSIIIFVKYQQQVPFTQFYYLSSSKTVFNIFSYTNLWINNSWWKGWGRKFTVHRQNHKLLKYVNKLNQKTLINSNYPSLNVEFDIDRRTLYLRWNCLPFFCSLELDWVRTSGASLQLRG